MSRRVSIALVTGLVLLATSCTEHVPDEAERTRLLNEGLRERMTVGRVKEGIAKSPNDWVAGIQEVVDDSGCFGTKDGSSCELRVRLVHYIGGPDTRPSTVREGWEYWNSEMRMPVQWNNRQIGRKRLVLSIRLEEKPDLYGNWIFVLDPTPDDVELLRKLLEEARMSGEATAAYERDGEWVIGNGSEVPGASGQGKTRQELSASLAEATLLIFEARREGGL